MSHLGGLFHLQRTRIRGLAKPQRRRLQQPHEPGNMVCLSLSNEGFQLEQTASLRPSRLPYRDDVNCPIHSRDRNRLSRFDIQSRPHFTRYGHPTPRGQSYPRQGFGEIPRSLMFFLLIPESGEGGLESPVLSPIFTGEGFDSLSVPSEGLGKGFLLADLDSRLRELISSSCLHLGLSPCTGSQGPHGRPLLLRRV